MRGDLNLGEQSDSQITKKKLPALFSEQCRQKISSSQILTRFGVQWIGSTGQIRF